MLHVRATRRYLEYCENLPAEDTLETCSDGIDNDGNGYTDCNDFSCSMSGDPIIVEYCENLPGEDTLEACMDGIDNDNNGFVDCNDFSCSRSEDQAILEYCDQQIENSIEQCSNGLDDDSDGFIRLSTTSRVLPGRRSRRGRVLQYAARKTAFPSANDGIDNDGNGFIDCADFGCSANPDIEVRRACQESLGLTPSDSDALCADGPR